MIAGTLVVLGSGSDLAGAQPQIRTAENSTATSTISPEDWEDPEKLRRKYEMQMSPAQYLQAMETTGMGAYASQRSLSEEQRRGSGWTRLGPIGAFGGENDAYRNGRISGITILPDGGSYVVYVGACQGGLWKTTEVEGPSWVSLGDALPNPSVRAFAVKPSNRDVIIVGTGDAKRFTGAGMYRTTDGGVSWSLIPLPASIGIPVHFSRIHFKLDDENVLVAASEKGILRSTDVGLSWDLAAFAVGGSATGEWTDLVLHPADPQTMYACRQTGTEPGDGVYFSTNAGDTWTRFDDADFPNGSSWDRASLAVCEFFPNHLAVVVANGVNIEAILKTTDGGADWIDITGTMAGTGGDQAHHAQAIAFVPTDPDSILVGARGLGVTTDGGTSWRCCATSDHGLRRYHDDITQLHFSPVTGDQILWICNDGGIYKHDRGTGITTHFIGDSQSGLSCSEIDFMDADREAVLLGMQDNGIARSMSSGDSWEMVTRSDGGSGQFSDAELGDAWFGKGVPWGIYRNIPPGDTERMSSSNAIPFEDNPYLFFDPFTDTIYTTGADGSGTNPQSIWVTPAYGSANWNAILTDLRPGDYNPGKLWGSKVDGMTLYVAYELDAATQRHLTVCRKSETTWSVLRQHENLAPAGGTVVTVYPSSEWPDECWVGLSSEAGQRKVLHTANGVDWEDITGNLADLNRVRSIVATPFNPLEIYVGTDIGVFRTTNGGASWETFQEALPIAICKSLSYVVDDGHTGVDRLLVATDGRGVYGRTILHPPIIYVDKTHTGSEDGTYEYPFNSVAEGIAVAPTNAIVAVRGETYVEPQTITDSLLIVTFADDTLIVDE